jgi:ubiquinone/menaquinone biosynthesis C-methylase UbiE
MECVSSMSVVAANLVGPTGQVVGVDRSAAALARARTRAEEQSLVNVTFCESELSEIAFDQRFDAAIGRDVLCWHCHIQQVKALSPSWTGSLTR